MNIDIPGYAMISGGPDSGKYVRDGKMYRRVGGSMYEVETGNAIPLPVTDKNGVIIGEPGVLQEHPGDHGIANRTRYSDEGVTEVLESSVESEEAQEDPIAPQEEEPSAPLTKKQRKAAAAAHAARVDGLIADYSAEELRSMLSALQAMDSTIEPRDGDDEEAVRHNADLIAKHTEA